MKMITSTGTILTVSILATAFHNVSSVATQSVMNSIVTRTRLAVDLTKKANIDPSFANEACEIWSSIFGSDANIKAILPIDAISAAHALFASALVRVGRDEDAIEEYKLSLKFLDLMNNTSITSMEIDTRLGLGNSFQRLFRYREAKEEFLDIAYRFKDTDRIEKLLPYYSESVRRAALCCMRLGDLDSAIGIICDYESSNDRMHEPELAAMKAVLLLLQSSTASDRSAAYQVLHDLPMGAISPLRKWLYFTSIHQNKDIFSISELQKEFENVMIQEFAEINNSAFDDPCLLYLDDKVLLHDIVLKSIDTSNHFTPLGFIFPRDLLCFYNAYEKKVVSGEILAEEKWMLKHRAGYGSYGNLLVDMKDIMNTFFKNELKQSLLCQQIIQPPMLITGRKFSLRIYVVFFPEGIVPSGDENLLLNADVLVSTEGLLKFASSEYDVDCGCSDSGDSLENQYMTNSGRGDGKSSQQRDLHFLKKFLEEKNSLSYERLWHKTLGIIETVMSRYIHLRCQQRLPPNVRNDSTTGSQCRLLTTIPKILGFDFILDSSERPWLLEVNRFPGLAPRSMMDAAVKRAIVYDAWLAAADRIGVPREILKSMRPHDYKAYSLIRNALNKN